MRIWQAVAVRRKAGRERKERLLPVGLAVKLINRPSRKPLEERKRRERSSLNSNKLLRKMKDRNTKQGKSRWRETKTG